MSGAATRTRYPLPAGLAAARLLGVLGSHRCDDELTAILATQPAVTWRDTLPRSCTAAASRTLIRLGSTFGAVLGIGGDAQILTGGRFARACELDDVNGDALDPPTVGWLLAQGDDARDLGFHTGAAGACAGLAALCVTRRQSLDNPRQPPVLYQPGGEPIDTDAAWTASCRAPTTWIAAAELFGAVAALDTWTPSRLGHVEPQAVLSALYVDDLIGEGPLDATGQPAWWEINHVVRYRLVESLVGGRAVIGWVEEHLIPGL